MALALNPPQTKHMLLILFKISMATHVELFMICWMICKLLGIFSRACLVFKKSFGII